MRIALFVDQFPKVSETFILNQIDGLLAFGHDITIFPREASGETKVHPIVYARRLIEKTRFPAESLHTRVGKAAFYLWLMKFALLHWKTRSRLKSTFGRYIHIGEWHAALVAAEPVRHFGGKFDVLFAHFGPSGLRASWYRDAGLVNGPLITVFHGFDLSSHLCFYSEQMYAPLFHSGDLFLPISRFWQDKLQSMGCPAERIKVHHVGIDCEHFVFQPRTRGPGEPTILISVARLVEKKGIEYAIQALASLVAAKWDIRYRIIGDGPLLESLKQLVLDLRLSDYVSFLGTKTSDEVAQELDSAHIFLAPSVTSRGGDMEGIPTVLMEAMASGLPVISTRHSGIPELVEEGVSGKLVSERDVPGLAQAIQELAGDVERWAVLGTAGREKVFEEFNINKLNRQLEGMFEQMRYNN